MFNLSEEHIQHEQSHHDGQHAVQNPHRIMIQFRSHSFTSPIRLTYFMMRSGWFSRSGRSFSANAFLST